MGLFDFFKKKKTNEKEAKSGFDDLVFNSEFETELESNNEIGVYELAYFSMKYEELNKDYNDYKNYFLSKDFNEDIFIHNTIGIILKYFYNKEFEDVKKLFDNISKDFENNEDINWLFIEVIALVNIPENIEFVNKFMNLKRQKNDFNFHYEVEYQKGIELKSLKYYNEALSIFEALNKVHPFAWNYYQRYIIKNILGELNDNHQELVKAIELDNSIKEDAKTYFELDNLRNNKEFLKIIE